MRTASYHCIRLALIVLFVGAIAPSAIAQEEPIRIHAGESREMKLSDLPGFCVIGQVSSTNPARLTVTPHPDFPKHLFRVTAGDETGPVDVHVHGETEEMGLDGTPGFLDVPICTELHFEVVATEDEQDGSDDGGSEDEDGSSEEIAERGTVQVKLVENQTWSFVYLIEDGWEIHSWHLEATGAVEWAPTPDDAAPSSVTAVEKGKAVVTIETRQFVSPEGSPEITEPGHTDDPRHLWDQFRYARRRIEIEVTDFETGCAPQGWSHEFVTSGGASGEEDQWGRQCRHDQETISIFVNSRFSHHVPEFYVQDVPQVTYTGDAVATVAPFANSAHDFLPRVTDEDGKEKPMPLANPPPLAKKLRRFEIVAGLRPGVRYATVDSRVCVVPNAERPEPNCTNGKYWLYQADLEIHVIPPPLEEEAEHGLEDSDWDIWEEKDERVGEAVLDFEWTEPGPTGVVVPTGGYVSSEPPGGFWVPTPGEVDVAEEPVVENVPVEVEEELEPGVSQEVSDQEVLESDSTELPATREPSLFRVGEGPVQKDLGDGRIEVIHNDLR